MNSFHEYLAQGNAWLFFPMAVFLGVLHGLEPGHSKTMMSAFIIAIRGSVWQAFLLGVSATISHTAVIWVLAFLGLHYSSVLNVEELEPYFQLATGIIVIGLAIWMLYRTYQAQRQTHHHDHKHDHEHNHDGHDHKHHEHKHHDHSHDKMDDFEFGDAHEREHALQLEKQLKNQNITTLQIILFGLTGGLLPCPSALAILLVCLQLKKFSLGFALVLGFSIGLAVTLVTVGVMAAMTVNHASRKIKNFGELARRMPYVSSAILILIGIVVSLQGLQHILK